MNEIKNMIQEIKVASFKNFVGEKMNDDTIVEQINN